jgi:hypothetical protein
MGKSFKNTFIKKPDSEKDILDLTIEEQDNRNISITSITPPKNDSDIAKNKDLRQTFLINESYFEKLKDYVHTKKITGEYTYTQKEAIHEALDLLFNTITLVPRPESVILKEKQRSIVLRSSRTKH